MSVMQYLLLVPTAPQRSLEKAGKGQAVEVTGSVVCKEKKYRPEYLKQGKARYRYMKRLKKGRI